MTSLITKFDIEKFDGNIVQNHGGSKQVGLKQLGFKRVGLKHLGTIFESESMEYRMKNVFGLRWNCKELKGIVKLKFFKLEQEKVHLGIKVDADITETEVASQEGLKDNAAGRKKRRSNEAKLEKLLKYKA
ncbi:hypothetical protein Tco_0144520 [Tanacetum coccineum]